MSLNFQAYRDMIFYSETDFQGDAVSVPAHEALSLFSNSVWSYRSVKINGYKFYANVRYNTGDEQYYNFFRKEFFVNEDIADLTRLTQGIDGVVSVDAAVLLTDDIIVSMDVINKMRGFETIIKTTLSAPFTLDTQCAFNDTQQGTPAVLAILNAESLLSSTAIVAPEASSLEFPQADKSSYGEFDEITVSYDPSKGTITLFPDFTDLPATIEKIDQNHFIVHFEYLVTDYSHCYAYDQEEYRGNIETCINAVTFDLKDSYNNWFYKSVSIYSAYNASFLWFNTPYPEGGVDFNFNQYRNLITNQGVDNVPAALNNTLATSVQALFATDVIPVFIRLNNAANPGYWQGFVLQSTFITPLLQLHLNQYVSFCMSKPDTQPGLLCPVSYAASGSQECDLRYGSLSEDGSVVTWSGECGIVVEQTSSGELNVTLNSDAPTDWVIRAVTREDDGWYVDLTGSVQSA
ncbi:hypothetical protein [Pseudescherichia sp.]|uniref:hypothetical protein n=1 Tax=Pseudescherichia sp. TaxID=2055881 RepID=UPI00289BDC80|nr:hypothetical protein [Pseudescherichia sp.]